MPRWCSGALALCSVLVCTAAAAATGEPIANNAYNVELHQGPVLAPLRVTGLAGAYTAYAEGVDGLPSNAAAPAVREPYSVHYLDYDIAFSLSFPAVFGRTDFDNDGTTGFTYQDFYFYTLGGMIQVGPFGIGVLGDFQRYDLSPNARQDDPQSALTVGRLDLTAGWAFFGHQLIIGGGARGVTLNIDTQTPGAGTDAALTMIGVAPQAGFLLRPDYLPWRIGVTATAAVDTAARLEGAVLVDPEGVSRAAGFAVPQSVHMPWELKAGFAIQVGPRPLNPRWIDPSEQEKTMREQIFAAREARAKAYRQELAASPKDARRRLRAQQLQDQERYLRRDEDQRLEQLEQRMLAERRARYWNWPREYILVVAEAAIIGPSDNAVSLESFLAQVEQPTGERITIMPKLGFEGEPVVGRIKTRFGTYIEPSRFAGRIARQHFTFGFDIHVFDFGGWKMFAPASFRLSGVADLAPRYENLGVSFGAWH